jgi:hypothetical protein
MTKTAAIIASAIAVFAMFYSATQPETQIQVEPR